MRWLKPLLTLLVSVTMTRAQTEQETSQISSPSQHRSQGGLVRHPMRIRSLQGGVRTSRHAKAMVHPHPEQLDVLKPHSYAQVQYYYVMYDKNKIDRETFFYLSDYRVAKNGNLTAYFAPTPLIEWVNLPQAKESPEIVIELYPPIVADKLPPVPPIILKHIGAENFIRPHKKLGSNSEKVGSAVERPVRGEDMAAEEVKILDDILMTLGQSSAPKNNRQRSIKEHEYPSATDEKPHLHTDEQFFAENQHIFETDDQNHVIVRQGSMGNHFQSVAEAHNQNKNGNIVMPTRNNRQYNQRISNHRSHKHENVENRELSNMVNQLKYRPEDVAKMKMTEKKKYEFAKVSTAIDYQKVKDMGLVPPPPPPLDTEFALSKNTHLLIHQPVQPVPTFNPVVVEGDGPDASQPLVEPLVQTHSPVSVIEDRLLFGDEQTTTKESISGPPVMNGEGSDMEQINLNPIPIEWESSDSSSSSSATTTTVALPTTTARTPATPDPEETANTPPLLIPEEELVTMSTSNSVTLVTTTRAPEPQDPEETLPPLLIPEGEVEPEPLEIIPISNRFQAVIAPMNVVQASTAAETSPSTTTQSTTTFTASTTSSTTTTTTSTAPTPTTTIDMWWTRRHTPSRRGTNVSTTSALPAATTTTSTTLTTTLSSSRTAPTSTVTSTTTVAPSSLMSETSIVTIQTVAPRMPSVVQTMTMSQLSSARSLSTQEVETMKKTNVSGNVQTPQEDDKKVSFRIITRKSISMPVIKDFFSEDITKNIEATSTSMVDSSSTSTSSVATSTTTKAPFKATTSDWEDRFLKNLETKSFTGVVVTEVSHSAVPSQSEFSVPSTTTATTTIPITTNMTPKATTTDQTTTFSTTATSSTTSATTTTRTTPVVITTNVPTTAAPPIPVTTEVLPTSTTDNKLEITTPTISESMASGMIQKSEVVLQSAESKLETTPEVVSSTSSASESKQSESISNSTNVPTFSTEIVPTTQAVTEEDSTTTKIFTESTQAVPSVIKEESNTSDAPLTTFEPTTAPQRRHHHHNRRKYNSASSSSETKSISSSSSKSSESGEFAGEIEVIGGKTNFFSHKPVLVEPVRRRTKSSSTSSSSSSEGSQETVVTVVNPPIAKPVPVDQPTTTATTTTTDAPHRRHHHHKHHHRRGHHGRRRSHLEYETTTTSSTTVSTTVTTASTVEETVRAFKVPMASRVPSSAEISDEEERVENPQTEKVTTMRTTATLDKDNSSTSQVSSERKSETDSAAPEVHVRDARVDEDNLLLDLMKEQAERHKNFRIERRKNLHKRVIDEAEMMERLQRSEKTPLPTPTEENSESKSESEKTYIITRTVKEIIPSPPQTAPRKAETREPIASIEQHLPNGIAAGGFIAQNVLASNPSIPVSAPVFVQNMRDSLHVRSQFAPHNNAPEVFAPIQHNHAVVPFVENGAPPSPLNSYAPPPVMSTIVPIDTLPPLYVDPYAIATVATMSPITTTLSPVDKMRRDWEQMLAGWAHVMPPRASHNAVHQSFPTTQYSHHIASQGLMRGGYPHWESRMRMNQRVSPMGL